jgi:hypothetical protein
MNLRPPLITDFQPTVPIQPTVRPLHCPTMPPQLLRRLNAFAGDAWRDAAPSQSSSFLPRVIGFVGLQLRRALARATTGVLDRADGIEGFFHHLDVVRVGSRDSHRQRDPLAFDHQVAFRALFAAIRRILPGSIAPFCAGTADESSDARDQSILSASPSRSSSTWCSLFHTPASCHSHKRRQHVMPEPQPISGGRYSQGRPVESTKRIPLSTSRLRCVADHL